MTAMNRLLPNVRHSFEFAEDGLPQLKPSAFSFREKLSAPYELHVQLQTKDPTLDEAKLVGQSCTLTLDRAGQLRSIHGLVTSATFSGVALNAWTPFGQLPTGTVHLEVRPAVWLLGQRKDMRIFQNETVPDIIKKVLSQGLQDYGRKVTMKDSKRYEPLEYCTQYDETDLDFVLRLMGEAGLMWYFKQGEKEEELVVFDDADNYQELLTLDHQPVPFETAMGEQQWVETVSSFQASTALRPTAARVRHFNWSVGSAPEGGEATGQDAMYRTRELYLGEAPVRLGSLQDSGMYQKSTATAQATLVKDVEASRESLYDGQGGVTGLAPGMVFELANSLREELNQKYLVTEVVHTGRPPSEEKAGSFAGNEAEVLYSNVFRCVRKDVLFRLPVPERRQVQTMQTAVVVGDEDITTDVHGRIKVQFHWDRKGKNDVNSSCWMRVAQASAGVGFGCVFIPRKGQEVVVSFLEGDPDKPLVIGSVYNGLDVPPYPLPKEKTRSVIRTRSTPNSSGYNELSFEDAKDAEQLYLQAQKDMKELVKHDHEVLIQNDERLTVDKNQTENIGENQTLSVGGNRTRSVKKDENITIDGNQTITIKGGGQSAVHSAIRVTGKHTFDASDTIEIQAPTSITLRCGGSTIVMEPGKITMKAGDQAKVVLDANVEASSPKGGNLKLDDKVTATSAKASTLQLDGDASLSGTTNASVSATAEATMSTGPSSVKTSPAGVETQGPKVDITGMATVTISAPIVKAN